MKSKKQLYNEAHLREWVCLRAHRDGLDITKYNFKTLNVVAKLYASIDSMEEYDKQLLAKYETNAITLNSMIKVSGIGKSTLEKEPYISILNHHRRKPKKEVKREAESILREEVATLRKWKEEHVETELKLLAVRKELDEANQTIKDLQGRLDRKDELLKRLSPQHSAMEQEATVEVSFPITPGDICS